MLLSVIIPAYNEEAVLPKLFSTLDIVMTQLDCDWEIIMVNDGSRDKTLVLLEEKSRIDSHYKVLNFTRNFGHQAAITAGIDFAEGDAVVVIDADLQDPPEILREMVDLYRQGYHVVSAQRVSREGESLFKRASADAFYWLMRNMVDKRIVSEVGDFRLFSRQAITVLRQFREQHRFMRGLVAWMGLREAILPFHRQERAAGETKYGLMKMLRFAWTAITSFSGAPLRLSLVGGFVLTTIGMTYFLYALYFAVFHKDLVVRGWTSLVFLQVLFSGAILLAIGLVGDYLARIYEESKARPLYVVDGAFNIEAPPRSIPRAVMLPPASARSVETPQNIEPIRETIADHPMPIVNVQR